MEILVIKPSKIEQYVIDYVIQLRKREMLSQSDIATIIDTKRTFVANVENINNRAKYNLNHIDKLADYFGLSPRDFLPENAFTKG